MTLMQRRGRNLTLHLSAGPAARSPAQSSTAVAEKSTGGKDLDQLLDEEFHVMAKLGSGATGTVKKAFRKADGCTVALKVTRAVDPEGIRFAQQEYEILRKLSFPTLPQVYSFFQGEPAQCRAAMVMELFEGSDLSKAVKSAENRRLGEGVALQLARQLLETVDYLHTQKVLHRDIKPENVMVSPGQWRLMLIDFNTAQSVRAGEPWLPCGGTQAYAAPEVLEGEASSAASDVWGAGLCVYFAVSGRLPQRRGEEMDSLTLTEVSTKAVVFPKRSWASVSEACQDCLHKCLAVDKAHRSPAGELIQHDLWLSPMSTDLSRRCLERSQSEPALAQLLGFGGCHSEPAGPTGLRDEEPDELLFPFA